MIATVDPTYVVCNGCHLPMPLSEYSASSHYRCKSCVSAKNHRAWKRRSAKQARRHCAVCGRNKPATSFNGDDDTCARCRYVSSLRKPKTPRPVEAPKPAAPRSIEWDAPHYPITRNAGRIPVLYGCRIAGEHACYISDGAETTAKHRHVLQAVQAWNHGEVTPV